MENLKINEAVSEMKECPEMHNIVTDPGLEIFQVTTDLESEAASPEMNNAPVSYSADSRRMVFCRTRNALGPAGSQRVEVTLCEIGERFALRALTDEPNVRSYVLSRDGKRLYYFVDDSADARQPRIVLKCVDIDNATREILMVVDHKVDGVGRAPRGGRMLTEASLSLDGGKISTSGSFYTDTDPMFASLIFDLKELTVRGFTFVPYSWRPTGLYCQDPAHADEMLIFDDHVASGTDVNGKWYTRKLDDVPSRTYHVIRDDGTFVASCPMGMVEGEGGPNHAIWRGNMYQVAGHMSLFNTSPFWRGGMILCEPIACRMEDRYQGAAIPGARRWELTRHIKRPDCFHIAFDPTGTRLVSDTEGVHGAGETSLLYAASVPDVPDPALIPRYVLHPNSSQHSYSTQPKPSMTPDGKWVFFRSDWLCKREHPQLFCVTGFRFP